MAANRLGRKGGGAFAALVSATVKYGLLENKKGTLSVTSRYRDLKLAYDDGQRVQALRSAFLNAPLFKAIYDRFVGKAVPIDILDKLLIKEFEVPQDLASRVGEYFLEGAKLAQLLSDGGVLIQDGAGPASPSSTASSPEVKESPEQSPPRAPEPAPPPTHYVIRVTGPGISTSIDIHNEEDLVIVDAVLTRIRRSLKVTS
jgi:hypothetical protein